MSKRSMHILHKNIQSTCDESGRLIWSKTGHLNSSASHNLLISSSCDQKLKLLNALNETCLNTFHSSHQQNIKCMQTNENILITGSKDNTLQILTVTNSPIVDFLGIVSSKNGISKQANVSLHLRDIKVVSTI
jgi:WD40 repeat protein